jgi:hypothetical protein
MSVAVPPRSALYNLEPIGMGTGSVECLTSYASRLAAAHCLSPAVLLGRTLAPLMNKKYWLQGWRPGTKGSALGNSFNTRARALNGNGVIARDWAIVIEDLTMRNDLRFLTMLPWANTLPSIHLLRPSRAWCPNCHEDQLVNDRVVYEPLLWALRDIQVCLSHRRRLRFQCPHCARQLSWLGRRTMPGRCSQCGKWLGDDTSEGSPDMMSTDEFAWQTWVVKNVEAMIVAATHLPSPPKERIARSLSLCIDRVSEGIMNRFASLIGKRKNTVWGWQHGKTNIPINDLLRICDRVGLSLVDFLYTEALTPNKADHPTAFPISDATAISRCRKKFDSAVIGRKLRTAAEHHPPLSMKEVAKIVNINKRFLYKHFADICKAIAARHAEYQRAREEELRREKEKTFRHISNELQALGIYPSRRRVAALMAKRSELRKSSSRKSSTGKNSQMAA